MRKINAKGQVGTDDGQVEGKLLRKCTGKGGMVLYFHNSSG